MATRKAVKKSAKKVTASSVVDEQLAKYRSMRDFGVTAEPAGGRPEAGSAQLPFVIQKHAATRLHYDFRLGWNGVLKSWAVAKGPSYVVAEKHLAVQVEDHPMEYGGFEGIIPKGQYGGGTVMVWDHGTWEPQAGYDVEQGLKDGSLKFILHGEKLKGKWALIRMKGGRFGSDHKPGAKPNWLLIKEHDAFERSSEDASITEAEPDSVITGRSMEEIASAEDHVWNSKETATSDRPWYRKSSKSISTMMKLPKEALPAFIAPQLATQVDTPPGGTGWLHELKLDGYRIQAHIARGKVKLFTRKGLDWTHRMRPVAAELSKLAVDAAILDGELCVVRPDGTTSFADLQASFEQGEKHPLTYFVFDLLHLDGHSTRGLPLVERKELLLQLLQRLDSPGVVYSQHLEGDARTIFENACKLRAEGIISKRADAAYRSTRSADWIKLKCIHQQEFVIGGFTLPSNGIHGVGALLLGYFEEESLVYAGRTGTGFNAATHTLLRDKLDKLRQAKSPFRAVPREMQKGVIWVKPQLVAQVTFANWTADKLVRQAAFHGLRDDKPAAEVHREEAVSLPHANRKAVTVRSRRRGPEVSVSETTSRAAEHPPIRLTHPDKVIDAKTGLTKQQLADYYWAIAPYMLPHIAHRPLSIVRCPEGAGHTCFYQKHANQMLPPGVESVMIADKKSAKPEPYITLSTPEALAGLAQIGVLEIHPWGSQNSGIETPDRVIIDLDPDTAISWQQLCDAAAEVRSRLKKLGLESFLKTTGGKGLHVVIPITPKATYAEVKQWAHDFVLQMERDNPRLYLTKMTKAARTGKIYLDYLRNERGATAVAPFSPRAREGVTVSLPLSWSSLKLPERPVFHVAGFTEWRGSLARDPWKKLPQIHQALPGISKT